MLGLLLPLLVLVAVAGCSDAAPSAPPLVMTPRPDAPARAELPDSVLVPPAVDVRGVVRVAGRAIGGRGVVIVDASGKRTDATTDGDGIFSARDVAVPYDVAVRGLPPSGDAEPDAPTVVLGLTLATPMIGLFEAESPAPPPARFTVPIKLPPCAGTCLLALATSSASARGAIRTSYADEEAIVVAFDHVWPAGTPPVASEGARLDVLAWDPARAAFAHETIEGLVVVPGETRALAPVVPIGIDDRPLTIAAGVNAVPRTWEWSTEAWLRLPGGGIIPLAYDPSSGLALRAPRVAGASVQALVRAELPIDEAQPELYRFAETWLSVSPSTEAPIVVDVATGPDFVRPSTLGTLGRMGLGFAWTRAGGVALASLTVVDVARGRTVARILTAGSEVPLARLARLDVPALVVGNHIASLTWPNVALDAALGEGASPLVVGPYDDRDGAVTHVRVPFTVTR